jgi:hypothetical protein
MNLKGVFKKVAKVTIALLLFVLVLFILITVFSDNPLKEYLSSEILQVEKCNRKNSKSIQINLKQLDSLFKTNPNTNFYFFTWYCGPCRNSIEKGSGFDSSENKKIIYVSVDNYSAVDKIEGVISKNNKINSFYYLEDKELSGIHFTRGGYIFEKYAPEKVEQIGYPFKLQTNENGEIDSFSFGTKITP